MDDVKIEKGESILNAQIRRSVSGLTVTAKASRVIEDYFKEHARGGRVRAAAEWDRSWIKERDYPDLLIYPITEDSPFARTLQAGEFSYTLAAPGSGLLLAPNAPGRAESLNLSWIRLVGISQEAGIRFSIKGVFTEKQTRQITERTQQAVKRFFLDYLRPVNVTILLTTQEASHV